MTRLELNNKNDFIYTKSHWKNGNIAPDVSKSFVPFRTQVPSVEE